MRDRVTATTMGYRALELLAEGHSGVVVAMHGDECIEVDIHEAISIKKEFDIDLYHMLTSLTFLDKNA